MTEMTDEGKNCSPPKDDSVDSSQQTLIVNLPVLLDLEVLCNNLLSLLVLLDLDRLQLALLPLILRFGDGLIPSYYVRPRDADLLPRVSELDILVVGILVGDDFGDGGGGEVRGLKVKRTSRRRHSREEMAFERSA